MYPWQIRNIEYVRRYAKWYRKNNPGKGKDWARANPEKVAAKSKRWREKNQDTYKEGKQRWERNNPEKIKAKKHRRRTRKTAAGGSYTIEQWMSLKRKYKFCCLRCGKRKKLTPDHVMPVSKGGTSNIDNIQPLCVSCNSIKGTKEIDYR